MEPLAWVEDQRSKRAAAHTEGHAGATGTWIDWTMRSGYGTEEADAHRKQWNEQVPGARDA